MGSRLAQQSSVRWVPGMDTNERGLSHLDLTSQVSWTQMLGPWMPLNPPVVQSSVRGLDLLC